MAARVKWTQQRASGPEQWIGEDQQHAGACVHVQAAGNCNWRIYHNYREIETVKIDEAKGAAGAKAYAIRYIFGCLPKKPRP